jgi:hypothetical protein
MPKYLPAQDYMNALLFFGVQIKKSEPLHCWVGIAMLPLHINAGRRAKPSGHADGV